MVYVDMFCRWCFVDHCLCFWLLFYDWPLYCLPFELRLLVTSLFSNCSWYLVIVLSILGYPPLLSNCSWYLVVILSILGYPPLLSNCSWYLAIILSILGCPPLLSNFSWYLVIILSILGYPPLLLNFSWYLAIILLILEHNSVVNIYSNFVTLFLYRPGKYEVIYVCVKGRDLASVYNLSVGLWTCCDSVDILLFIFFYFIFFSCPETICFTYLNTKLMTYTCTRQLVVQEVNGFETF